jgi:hypothetical protein
MKRIILPALLALAGGCYHYTFAERPRTGRPTITYSERQPTWAAGFVGHGRMDTAKYCAHPVKTEVRATALDVTLATVTLLVYTPHTLYVTCEVPDIG